MKVTVWVADGEPFDGVDYGTRIVEQFHVMGGEVERRDLTTITGDEDIDEGLHVLTGGETSVNDESTWMPKAKKLVGRMIDKADGKKTRVLGVCLGSQIIADVLSHGSVDTAPAITAGLVDVSLGDGQEDDCIPAFFYERINAGKVQKIDRRAVNEDNSVLVFTHGNGVAGTQLHPEFSAEDMTRLIHFNSVVIGSHGGHALRSISDTTQSADRVRPFALPELTDSLLGTNFTTHM